MTRRIERTAALGAAVLLFAAPVTADDITITSGNGGLSLTGPYIGYDGTYLVIGAEQGPLTVLYDNVSCEGAACPDADNFVPLVRVSGAPKMAETLLPALIDGFARASDMALTRIDKPDGFDLTLSRDGIDVGSFSFTPTSSEEGFADLTAHLTDMAMSLREVRTDERDRAQEAGAGRLDGQQQSRIVALDALVPVTSPLQTVQSLSLRDLAAVFAGQITNWSALGGSDVAINLHLGPPSHGLSERITDIFGPPSQGVNLIRHSDWPTFQSAVAADANAIGITSYASVGVAQQMYLVDDCGFAAVPQVTTLKAEDYPLTAPLFLYLPERRLPALARDFLAFTRTPAAQLIVRRAGYVDQGPIPIPLDAQGQRFASAIAEAGPEVSLGELQRMVRVLRSRTRLSLSFRFEVGSTRLDAQSRSNLLLLRQAIAAGQFTNNALLFVGFSDGRGDAIANRDLSSARAEAVRRDLEDIIDPTQFGVAVETEAFGEALPIGCDDTEWGRQMNRRVELWVSE